MNKIKRGICFLLAIAALISVPVYAENSGTRASSYFLSYSAYLHPTSSTAFEVWFSVMALNEMDELGASVIKVQRSSDGSNWYTVRTYTKEMYPQLICRNTGAHGACVSYTSMEPGFYYRAYVEFYAKNSSGTGYVYYYTARL